MRYIVYRLVSVDYWWGRLNLLNRLELGERGLQNGWKGSMVEWRGKLAGSFWGVALEQGCDLGAEIK